MFSPLNPVSQRCKLQRIFPCRNWHRKSKKSSKRRWRIFTTFAGQGGSPQGARSKALAYRNPVNFEFSTQASDQNEAWLIKFPAQQEYPEVCAIEAVYAECLRLCAIETPDTHFFNLPNGLMAFASKRFDRQNGMRIPMQSLAAYTGADYKVPGSLDYRNFLRATLMCTQDVRKGCILLNVLCLMYFSIIGMTIPRIFLFSWQKMVNGNWLQPMM